MIDVFAETTRAAGATIATGCTILLATVTLGSVFVETFIEDAICELATAAAVAVAVTLPLNAGVPVATVVVVLLTVVVVIGFVLGIKVDRAEFGLEPAGGTAEIFPDVVVAIRLNGFACVLATVAAAATVAVAVVLGVVWSAPPAATNVDIVLHSRPLLIVPDDRTFVVAAESVADVASFLAVFSFTLSPAIRGCLLGFTSGNALGCGACCG